MNVQTSIRFILISSVSVLFIDNIDNIVLANTLPACYRNELSDYIFELQNCPSMMKIIARTELHGDEESKKQIRHRGVLHYQLYYQGVIYLVIAVIAVYGIR